MNTEFEKYIANDVITEIIKGAAKSLYSKRDEILLNACKNHGLTQNEFLRDARAERTVKETRFYYKDKLLITFYEPEITQTFTFTIKYKEEKTK